MPSPKKSVKLSFSAKRIANSNNGLRQSEIRRSFCIVASADVTLCVTSRHTRNAEGQFILPSYIIQRVGFGEPVVTVIEV